MTTLEDYFSNVVASRKRFTIGGVGVDAAVAQEGPVAAHVFHGAEVYFADEDFFLVV